MKKTKQSEPRKDLKAEMRAQMRREHPEMTDEQFEREWDLVKAMGLDA